MVHRGATSDDVEVTPRAEISRGRPRRRGTRARSRAPARSQARAVVAPKAAAGRSRRAARPLEVREDRRGPRRRAEKRRRREGLGAPLARRSGEPRPRRSVPHDRRDRSAGAFAPCARQRRPPAARARRGAGISGVGDRDRSLTAHELGRRRCASPEARLAVARSALQPLRSDDGEQRSPPRVARRATPSARAIEESNVAVRRRRRRHRRVGAEVHRATLACAVRTWPRAAPSICGRAGVAPARRDRAREAPRRAGRGCGAARSWRDGQDAFFAHAARAVENTENAANALRGRRRPRAAVPVRDFALLHRFGRLKQAAVQCGVGADAAAATRTLDPSLRADAVREWRRCSLRVRRTPAAASARLPFRPRVRRAVESAAERAVDQDSVLVQTKLLTTALFRACSSCGEQRVACGRARR